MNDISLSGVALLIDESEFLQPTIQALVPAIKGGKIVRLREFLDWGERDFSGFLLAGH